MTDFPPGSKMLCPACGAEVTTYDYDADMVEVRRKEPAWKGGPMIEVPDPTGIVKHKDVNKRFTFKPCGHVVPAVKGLTFTVLPPGSQP